MSCKEVKGMYTTWKEACTGINQYLPPPDKEGSRTGSDESDCTPSFWRGLRSITTNVNIQLSCNATKEKGEDMVLLQYYYRPNWANTWQTRPLCKHKMKSSEFESLMKGRSFMDVQKGLRRSSIIGEPDWIECQALVMQQLGGDAGAAVHDHGLKFRSWMTTLLPAKEWALAGTSTEPRVSWVSYSRTGDKGLKEEISCTLCRPKEDKKTRCKRLCTALQRAEITIKRNVNSLRAKLNLLPDGDSGLKTPAQFLKERIDEMHCAT